jgi:hypothetical protein
MKTRSGLRIRPNKNVDDENAYYIKHFAKWLRKNYEFPVRVPVYVSEKKYVLAKNGEEGVSIFFAPYNNEVEPYIKMATGDFRSLIKELGFERAVFDILFSLAQEIENYYMWLDNNTEFDTYDPSEDAREIFQTYLDESTFEFPD